MLAARWLGQQAAEKTVQIVVARSDMMQGQAVGVTSLEALSWPAATVPEGAFNDVKALEGRVVRTPIFKGEPILRSSWRPSAPRPGSTPSSRMASAPSR